MSTAYDRPASRLLMVLFAALLLFGFASVVSAKGVKTDKVRATEVQPGTYTLMTTHTPVPIAILKKEGTPYDLKLANATRKYTVINNLGAPYAIGDAEAFLKKDPSVKFTRVNEIKAPDGSVIGYEVKPEYEPLRYGASDIVRSSYRVKGDTVMAYVTPDPMIQSLRYAAS